MAWRIHGKAAVDVTNPQAFAICDACGGMYNHHLLRWQYQFAGETLQNTGRLVCEKCQDALNPQLRPRFSSDDPAPTLNARPEPFLIDDLDYQVTQDGEILIAKIEVTETADLTDDDGELLTDDTGAVLTTDEEVVRTEISPTVGQNVANNREGAG